MPHGRGGLERRACEAHIVNVNGMRIIMIHAHWTTPFFPKSASDSSPIGRLFRLSGDDHDPNGDPESGTRPAPGTSTATSTSGRPDTSTRSLLIYTHRIGPSFAPLARLDGSSLWTQRDRTEMLACPLRTSISPHTFSYWGAQAALRTRSSWPRTLWFDYGRR